MRLGRPPALGPRIAGPLVRARGRWHRLFAECAAKYGDTVRLTRYPVGVLVANPRDVEEVLLTNHRNFTKHFAIRRNRTVFGGSLMVSEGEEWLGQRRRAQPAFSRSRVASYVPIIVEETERMLSGWKAGDRRDVHEEAEDLALAIVARLLLGADTKGEDRALGAGMRDVMDAFARRSHAHLFFPEGTPFPANLRLRRAVGRLEAVMAGALARRTGGEDDILGQIEGAALAAGRPLSDRERWELLLTLFQAGQHTTAAALAWTWLLLDRHPDAREALEREAEEVLGDRVPAADDVARLSWAEAVVRESLRLYPPVWSFGRHAVDACELGGYRIPAGATILMSQWVVHRDARWFDDPEEFRPARWNGGLSDRLPRYAYFPFAGGPRLCIGESLALTEMVLIVAMTARRFRLAVPAGHEVSEEAAFTLRPRGGLPMRVETATRKEVAPRR